MTDRADLDDEMDWLDRNGRPSSDRARDRGQAGGAGWGEPKPLPTGLSPVASFETSMVPATFGPWIQDIADRMQCPPDFLGASAMVAAASVLGRKIAVRPQAHTDWTEVPNLWGCIVGRPGAMKSPAMSETTRPVNRLEAAARKAGDEAVKEYELEVEAHKLRRDEAAKAARAALKNGAKDVSDILGIAVPEAPKVRRYITNDTTYESLGEILAANPNGVLAFRDELVSLLKTLDRDESAAARGFFLTAWNGKDGYTFDRIIRGRTHVEAACISLLGSTQPGRLAEYMRRAVKGGAADDGLIQRFSVLVWPDQSPNWREVDRWPNSEARQLAWDTFTRLDAVTAADIKGEVDAVSDVPYLRLDAPAREVFADFRADLEGRLRSGDLHPALESHLAKYRKLVPTLALINHVAEGGAGPITVAAMNRALAFTTYLETHARRAYGAGIDAEIDAAKAILARTRRGDLKDGFTARDVYRAQWSNLSDREQIDAGLDLLADFDWLAADAIQTGGRPKTIYRINPHAFA